MIKVLQSCSSYKWWNEIRNMGTNHNIVQIILIVVKNVSGVVFWRLHSQSILFFVLYCFDLGQSKLLWPNSWQLKHLSLLSHCLNVWPVSPQLWHWKFSQSIAKWPVNPQRKHWTPSLFAVLVQSRAKCPPSPHEKQGPVLFSDCWGHDLAKWLGSPHL